MADQDPNLREYGRSIALAQVGIEMVVPIALGAVLDYVVGWGYWATVAGALIGPVGGMIHLIVMAQAIEREETRKKNDGS